MTDLFVIPPVHDPGGKSTLRMLPGHRGSAEFTPCGRYRRVLTRIWGDENDCPYLMAIGMNPSTATSHSDDPTIRRELALAAREGYQAYVKCNIMDYRATNPRELRNPTVLPRSDENLRTIKAYAERASKIVVAWGYVHPSLQGFASSTVRTLEGYKLWCLGVNRDGSPKHILYIKSDTPLEVWRPI